MATDFFIGADPEFCCTKGRRLIHAIDVTGSVDSDFGTDGNESTFEIRPAPSKCPIELVGNIHKLFVGAVKKHPELLTFDWHAGSYKNDLPLGGHIHFGVSGMEDEFIKRFDDYRFTYYCLVLSRYVGVMNYLLDDHAAFKMRICRGYGRADGYRPQDHGFEYRLPSSWLTSPYIAAAILCLSKTVMWEVINKNIESQGALLGKARMPEGNIKNGNLSWLINDVRGYNQIFNNSANKIEILQKFPAIWEEITKMDLYPQYKGYIDLLHFLVTNKLTWFNQGVTMNVAWGLTKPQVVRSKIPNFKMSEIWAEYLSKLNPNSNSDLENELMSF